MYHFGAAAQMNSKHLHAKPTRGFDCLSDRVWNVVQLEIEPNLGACGQNRAHNSGAFRCIKLQPDLEKRDLVAQRFNELKRFSFCRNIQRDNDFVSCLIIPVVTLSCRAESRDPGEPPLRNAAGFLDFASLHSE